MWHTLIVEDNRDFRQMLRDILKAEFSSMRISEAESAEQALRRIGKTPPDLAFLDIRLPGENGLELAKKLRSRFPDIIIVILTSYDTPEYRQAAARQKIDHFLLKGSTTRVEIVKLLKSILSDRHV